MTTAKWLQGAALTLCIGFFVVRTADALSCYQCTSTQDPDGCANGAVDQKHKSPCPESNHTAVLCRKIRQWVDFKVLDLEPGERVIRKCGYETTERACYYRAGFGGRQDVCTCFKDDCNGAPSKSLPIVAVLPAAIVIVMRSIGLL